MNGSISAPTRRRATMLRAAALLIMAWPMAAFFAFVGWYKAFASMEELASHGAWTAHVPEWIGRPMGWTELAGGAAMALAAIPSAGRPFRPYAVVAAVWLAASQILSGAIHSTHGEASALPQNVFLLVTLLIIAALCRASSANRSAVL